jgi:hypothetical protein
MTRTSLTLFFLTALGTSAHAVLPVEDYAALAQRAQKSIVDAYSQAVNYAKYVAQEADAYATSVYTYEQKLNSYEQLFRYGTATNTIGRIPGVSTVANLYQDVQRYRNYAENWRSIANPDGFQQSANAMLASYRQPSVSSFTTASGYQVPVNQGVFVFDTQRWNLADSTLSEVDKLQQRKQQYLEELDTVTRLHEQSRTDQDARKYGDAMAAIGKKIGMVDGQIKNAGLASQLQLQKVDAEENVVKTNRFQQQYVTQGQAIDAELSELPDADFHRGIKFPN